MGRRPRVDYDTLLRMLAEGGLVLISIKAPTIAMAGKNILWTVAVGDHTLQWILRAKIVDLSERRWGCRDFSWLVSPQNTKPLDEFVLWNNHCALGLFWEGRLSQSSPLPGWREVTYHCGPLLLPIGSPPWQVVSRPGSAN